VTTKSGTKGSNLVSSSGESATNPCAGTGERCRTRQHDDVGAIGAADGCRVDHGHTRRPRGRYHLHPGVEQDRSLAFEEEFGLEIPGEAAEKMVTVKDAVEFLTGHRCGRSP